MKQTQLIYDNYRESLMMLLEQNKGLITYSEHLETYKGLLHLEKDLGATGQLNDTFDKDTQVVINGCIDLLTTLENSLSQRHKEEFEAVCTNVLDLEKLIARNFYTGQLVTVGGVPCQIYEIDYNDLSISVGYDMLENPTWVVEEEIDL